MFSQRVDTNPILFIQIILPNFNRIIIATRKQNIFNRTPLHHLNILRVPLQNSIATEVIFILKIPNPNRLVSTASSKVIPGNRPRHGFDFVLMAFERRDALEAKLRFLPNIYPAIKRRCC